MKGNNVHKDENLKEKNLADFDALIEECNEEIGN